MPGIFDIFKVVANAAEIAPWRTKLLVGATAGVAYESLAGDPDASFGDRVSKGLLLGGIAGLASPELLRGAGRVAQGGEWLGKKAIASKFRSFQTARDAINPATGAIYGGWHAAQKTLFKPVPLMLAGAGLGAYVAPEGHRMQGAVIGGGLGFLARPGYKIYQGYEALGKVPGAQTAALLTAAAIPVAAKATFGDYQPEVEGAAVPGIGGTMDYQALSGNMAERVIAMNASGDIVLGLNGRRHG